MSSEFPPWMKIVRIGIWLAGLHALIVGGWPAVIVLALVVSVVMGVFGMIFPEVAEEAEENFRREQRRRPWTWWIW